jgi:hypothetical protein
VDPLKLHGLDGSHLFGFLAAYGFSTKLLFDTLVFGRGSILTSTIIARASMASPLSDLLRRSSAWSYGPFESG